MVWAISGPCEAMQTQIICDGERTVSETGPLWAKGAQEEHV